MLTLGIDPGAAGAFVLLGEREALAWDMPVHHVRRGGTTKTRVDLGGVCDLVAQIAMMGPTLAALEDVNGLPGQSAPAAFSFGRSAGAVETALVAFKIPYRLVPPATWKRYFRLKGDKDDALAFASQTLPAHRALWTPSRGALTKAACEGRADAALIAAYARTLL